MPLSFPSSPTVNQTATLNGRAYKWTGSVWEFVSSGGGSDSRWDLFLPPAPTNLTATGGNAQVALSWTAPTVLAQTPITDYVVQYSSNSGSTWTTFSDGTSTAASATVTGLTNGTAYTFRVAAMNGIGQGAWSANSSSVTPGSDPYFSNVSLLLHMDGSNGSTVFTDSSGTPKTVSRTGATISTAQAKFGGASGVFDGTNNFLTVNSSAMAFGTGDFTAEAWCWRSPSTSTFAHVFDTRTSDAVGFSLGTDDNGNVFMFSQNAFRVQATAFPNSQWNHLAISRASGTFRVFLNGTQVGSTYATSANYSQTLVNIGNYYLDSQYRWNGYLDEIRWTVGVARYTANFTPPTAAFPNS